MKSKEPVLVVMAAGMGSRYGGLKQLDPVGPTGEILMDYSVYDALQAGFKEVIFIIRREFEAQFDQLVARKLGNHIRYRYAFQDLHDLPADYHVPEGRVKPWGTGHAILAARDMIDGPFAVINADDYYGQSAYAKIFGFLKEGSLEDKVPKGGLCVWQLRETLSNYGHVSRGVCDICDDGQVKTVTEIKRIERDGNNARFTTDNGKSYRSLDGDSPVSMNFWGFPRSFLDVLSERFPIFLKDALITDPLTAEYLLPVIVGDELSEGAMEVHAMAVEDSWFGVTNREDRPRVQAVLADYANRGIYPSPLWS